MQRRAVRGIALSLIAGLASACATTGAPPRPFPTPPEAPPIAEANPLAVPPATGHDGYAIARTGLALRGIPYRLGGADPGGFDCSGLVQYVFALHGLGLPRVVREQYRYGIPVELDDLAPGDLVFFETQGGEVSHVGIALGGDQFVHAPNSRGTVRVNRLTSGYWGERAIGGRRLVTGTTATQ